MQFKYLLASCFVLSLFSTGHAGPAECPAPGSADAGGRYSCNPAHQYPNGQTCRLIDGCYYLEGTGGQSTGHAGPPECPAPGSSDAGGRYSCNPAHQYPNGQTCRLIDGCYYLVQGTGDQ